MRGGGRAVDATSDYGTMSNKVEDEMLEDMMPGLNLGGGGGTVFNDISIPERQERIDSIISEILAVPRLSEAILSQRSNKKDSKGQQLRGRAGSQRSTAMSGKLSSQSQNGKFAVTGQSESGKVSNQSTVRTNRNRLVRSISSPRVDIETRRSYFATGEEIHKPSVKKNLVPNLNLSGISQMSAAVKSKKKGGVIKSQNHKISRDSSKQSDLSKQSGLGQHWVPNLGEDTQNELVIIPPTFGDDTTQINSDSLNESSVEESMEARKVPDKPNHILQNIRSSSSTSFRKPQDDPATGAGVKHKSGSVPKYLKNRQKQWRDEAQAVIDNTPDPDCPPGHFRIQEEERVGQLAEMKTHQHSLLMDMNRLPVSSDTRRVRELRATIEGNLAELEEKIRIYSRPKVFLPQTESVPAPI